MLLLKTHVTALLVGGTLLFTANAQATTTQDDIAKNEEALRAIEESDAKNEEALRTIEENSAKINSMATKANSMADVMATKEAIAKNREAIAKFEEDFAKNEEAIDQLATIIEMQNKINDAIHELSDIQRAALHQQYQQSMKNFRIWRDTRREIFKQKHRDAQPFNNQKLKLDLLSKDYEAEERRTIPIGIRGKHVHYITQ